MRPPEVVAVENRPAGPDTASRHPEQSHYTWRQFAKGWTANLSGAQSFVAARELVHPEYSGLVPAALMSLGDQSDPKQFGKSSGIHRIRLDLCIANRLEHLGMCQRQGYVMFGAPIGYPIPIAGAFNDGLDRAGKPVKERTQIRRRIGHLFLRQQLCVVIYSYKCHISAM